MAEWSTQATNASELDDTEEQLLLARLHRIEGSAAGCFSVHLNLSKLRPNHKQSRFIEIAARTFDILVDNNDALLFQMANKDLALVCRNVDVEDVDAAIEKIRTLFSEDPLTELDKKSFDDQFSTWYDLSNSEDFAAFLAVVTDLAVEAEKARAKVAARIDKARELGEPLGPSSLTNINRKLQGMWVADMIKRQACLQVKPGGGGDLVFCELFLSMADVKIHVAPDINLFTSPWLFQYLTETLDKRLLAVLMEENFKEIHDPLSINLNISTVLSRDFQNFHRIVDGHMSKIIVEFQGIDIFSDMKSYAYARDSLQERGYRVVLDGLTPLSLQYFEPAYLQSDFIKISWGSEFTGDEGESRLREMSELIAKVGRDSVVLARVDSENAVKWGLDLGISRFQGFFIDRLAQAIGGRNA